MDRRARAVPALAVGLTLALAGCYEGTPVEPADGPQFARQEALSEGARQITAYMDALNVALAEEGTNYRVAYAEYLTDGAASHEPGNTVLAKDVGNKRLPHHFVPGDPRRLWSGSGGTAITYAIDRTGDAVPFFGDIDGAGTDAAIVAASMTWNEQRCSELSLTRNPDFGLDIGVVAFRFGLGGSPFIFADVQHAGWRDINFAGGILGVAFTFRFIDENGDPTDIDNDGRMDAAFREIYYDPSFAWSASGGPFVVDVETIALHEIGHGLSQGHFGTVRIKNDGSLQVSPRAVMNALYTGGAFRSLENTDIGGHCANWGNWPNRDGVN